MSDKTGLNFLYVSIAERKLEQKIRNNWHPFGPQDAMINPSPYHNVPLDNILLKSIEDEENEPSLDVYAHLQHEIDRCKA